MMVAETYQYREAVGGNGMFFYTDCGNRMYSVDVNPRKYHGRLCPRCLMSGRQTTLFLRGTPEAIDAWNRRADNES